jgi:3-hydroxybutyryl-CoA dehydratase
MELQEELKIRMELNDYPYEQIEVGKIFQFKKNLTSKDVQEFSKITGDENPLHLDEKYAKTTPFNGRICQGMLVASLFSTLFGMVCPGKKNLYLSQTLNFKKPVKIDSELIIRGTVKQKIDSLKIVVVKTEIFCGEELTLIGEARVQVLE